MRICETQRSESKNRKTGEEGDKERDQTNSARTGTKRIYQTCIIGPRFCQIQLGYQHQKGYVSANISTWFLVTGWILRNTTGSNTILYKKALMDLQYKGDWDPHGRLRLQTQNYDLVLRYSFFLFLLLSVIYDSF